MVSYGDWIKGMRSSAGEALSKFILWAKVIFTTIYWHWLLEWRCNTKLDISLSINSSYINAATALVKNFLANTFHVLYPYLSIGRRCLILCRKRCNFIHNIIWWCTLESLEPWKYWTNHHWQILLGQQPSVQEHMPIKKLCNERIR